MLTFPACWVLFLPAQLSPEWVNCISTDIKTIWHWFCICTSNDTIPRCITSAPCRKSVVSDALREEKTFEYCLRSALDERVGSSDRNMQENRLLWECEWPIIQINTISVRAQEPWSKTCMIPSSEHIVTCYLCRLRLPILPCSGTKKWSPQYR